jgi:hypothetical protein
MEYSDTASYPQQLMNSRPPCLGRKISFPSSHFHFQAHQANTPPYLQKLIDSLPAADVPGVHVRRVSGAACRTYRGSLPICIRSQVCLSIYRALSPPICCTSFTASRALSLPICICTHVQYFGIEPQRLTAHLHPHKAEDRSIHIVHSRCISAFVYKVALTSLSFLLRV